MRLFVDVSLLASEKKDLEEDVRRIGQLIAQVSEETEELNQMWSGTKQQSFQKTAAADKEKLNEIFLDMKKIIEDMEAAQKEYESCEETVSDIIRAIRV